MFFLFIYFVLFQFETFKRSITIIMLQQCCQVCHYYHLCFLLTFPIFSLSYLWLSSLPSPPTNDFDDDLLNARQHIAVPWTQREFGSTWITQTILMQKDTRFFNLYLSLTYFSLLFTCLFVPHHIARYVTSVISMFLYWLFSYFPFYAHRLDLVATDDFAIIPKMCNARFIRLDPLLCHTFWFSKQSHLLLSFRMSYRKITLDLISDAKNEDMRCQRPLSGSLHFIVIIDFYYVRFNTYYHHHCIICAYLVSTSSPTIITSQHFVALLACAAVHFCLFTYWSFLFSLLQVFDFIVFNTERRFNMNSRSK